MPYFCSSEMKPIRILFVWIFLSVTAPAFSQCSVCQVAAESNINKNENKVGRGLNTGILYLMAVPYMMGGIGFFIWYKHRKRTA